MRTLISIFLTVFFTVLLMAAISKAQSPVPEPDTVNNQLRQGDPTPQNVSEKSAGTTDRIKITAEELPKEVKRTLQSSAEFSGWERGKIYKARDGKSFIVEFSEADTTRSFRFDRNGRLVLK